MNRNKNILDTIAEANRVRVAEQKNAVSLEEMKALAARSPEVRGFPFEAALAAEGMSFICECKKASPSKGLIAPEFPFVEIAEEYESAGAAAISVLTEPRWFMGSIEYLRGIAAAVSVPCLRKDFVVDEYMIYEARAAGASAVLLICALLDDRELVKYIEICDSLGLSALVEAHDEEEIRQAVRCGARVIGVNNRDLKTFSVDVNNGVQLRKTVPADILFIAESGIKTAEDIRILHEANVNGVLIGETLMRADDKRAMLDELKGGCHDGDKG